MSKTHTPSLIKHSKNFKYLVVELMDASSKNDLSTVKNILKNNDFLNFGVMRNYYIKKACLNASKNNSKAVMDYLFVFLIKNNYGLMPNDILPIIEDRLSKNDEDFYLEFISEKSNIISNNVNNYKTIIESSMIDILKFSMRNKKDTNILKLVIDDFNNFNNSFMSVVALKFVKSINHLDVIIEKLKENDFINKGISPEKENIIRHIISLKSPDVNNDIFAKKLMDLISFDDVKKYISYNLEDYDDLNHTNISFESNVRHVVYNYIYPIKEKEYLKNSIPSNTSPLIKNKRKI